jgi:nucleotide-binding universal stress UspA family protein
MIPQIKKTLYATDLSKNSAYAFRYAMDLAEKYDAEIVVLHVIEPIPPMVKHYVKGFVDEINWEEKVKYQQEMAIERIKKRLEEFCKRETQDAPQCLALVSTILVRPGHPVEEILKTVDEEQCNLTILGTHGKGFLKQTFLGSVARSVLDRARKPVFIIPIPHEETGVTMGDI